MSPQVDFLKSLLAAEYSMWGDVWEDFWEIQTRNTNSVRQERCERRSWVLCVWSCIHVSNVCIHVSKVRFFWFAHVFMLVKYTLWRSWEGRCWRHTATHGDTLQCTATRCDTRQHTLWRLWERRCWRHTATHCDRLQHTATHCNTLWQTAIHCNTLWHTATHRNTLQYTAIYCNILQHTATHCNTLQHTATRYNTRRVSDRGYG